MNYKVNFQGKKYELNKDNLQDFFNDEIKPIKNFSIEKLIEIFNDSDKINFEQSYYKEACYNCNCEYNKDKNYFKFIEYNFYLYTKNENYIISNIEKNYEGLSFNKLFKIGKIDDSYILT
ncbi:DUF3785 family protein, partial [Clostridium tarantellae]